MAFRLSFVRMYMSTLGRGTPTPFAEIRAFIYLRSKPQLRTKAVMQARLVREVDATEQIIEGIGAGIERGSTIGTDFNHEIKNPTKITLIPPTNQKKVVIEGMEVEQVDPDEMPQMYDGMFISKKFSQARGGDWRYFSRAAQDRVMKTNNILELKLNRVYRYFARFDSTGKIDWEYDESQLKRFEQEADLKTIRTRLIDAIGALDTGDIQKDINILRELNERLIKLRQG